MINSIALEHPCNLVPRQIDIDNHYKLGNGMRLQEIFCKTSVCSKSFLPNTTRLWNMLPHDVKHLSWF